MARTKRRKLISGGFILGLSIYAILLAAAIAAGLAFFWSYIQDYEETRPATILNQYMAQLDKNYLQAHAQDFLATLDQEVQSPEESMERIWQELEREPISYARQPQESDESLRYVLRSGSKVFGSIALTSRQEDNFGFSQWEVTQESFDFDFLCSEAEWTVPSDWSVVLNGKTLDEAYITEEKIPYAMLEELYGGSYTLPYMVTYHADRYIGELSAEILDQNGQPVDAANLQESYYTDNCTDEEKAALEAFVSDYVSCYVNYMGSHDMGSIYVTYTALIQLVLPGTELESRLAQVEGLGFSWSDDHLESVTVNGMMNIGGGYYVADATYLVNTLGHGEDYVLTTNNVKFVLLMTDYGLRAVSQISY